MSIELKYWLARNRRSIKRFIVEEKISSYDDILKYCEHKGCKPISEKEYLDVIQDKKVEENIKVEPKATKSKNATKAKRTKTQTKRKPRTRKAQD